MTRWERLVFAGTSSLLIGSAASCMESRAPETAGHPAETATAPPPPEACSTGSAYPPRFDFPVRKSDPSVTYGECVPRCGATRRHELRYMTDALPQGECRVGAAPCTMAAYLDCGCGGEKVGDYSGYVCECVNGHWACAKLDPVGGASCGVGCGTP
jgi:hypothetical protein